MSFTGETLHVLDHAVRTAIDEIRTGTSLSHAEAKRAVLEEIAGILRSTR